MDKVQQHFEAEAREFDRVIEKLIPHYREMLDALVSAIPFEKTKFVRALDVGCGTGTLTQSVLNAFPSAQVTCIDFAEKMVEMARIKLAGHANVRYVVKDFREFEWSESYHVVVSSLALHHLVTDAQKQAFYRQVCAGLEPGGCFYNADVVLASNSQLQELYLARWKGYMRREIGDEEVEHWLAKYRDEDRPAQLVRQLDWLRSAGFTAVDVIWKYYNFAVYGGMKAA